MPEPDLGITGIDDLEPITSTETVVVYRARLLDSDRWVAIKVLRGLDDTRTGRFDRGRSSITELARRDGIVSIGETGFTANGEPYLITTWFPDGSLQDSVDTVGPLGVDDAIEVMELVGRAVHLAHQHNVIHDDIRPGNIYLDETGRPQIADLGLASFLRASESNASDEPPARSSYRAPEVTAGSTPSVVSDVYSLGATLFTLLSGQAPPSELGEEFGQLDPSDDLWALVKAAMSADPWARTATAGLFADGLATTRLESHAEAGIRSDDPPARAPRVPSDNRHPVRPHQSLTPAGHSRTRVSLLVAVALLLVGIGAVVASVSSSSEPESSSSSSVVAVVVATVDRPDPTPTPVPPDPGTIDITDSDTVRLVGVAALSGSAMRLTPSKDLLQAGAAWLIPKQVVVDGFTATFTFRVSGLEKNPGDGFAFVIQGASESALGLDSYGIGYDGIRNSVAVEFDMVTQGYSGDRGLEHVGIHTDGRGRNTSHEAASLASVSPPTMLADGNAHKVRVEYVPGTMSVYLDDYSDAVLSVELDLNTLLSLADHKAWVGFTASTEPGFRANHDILDWTFSPN